MNVAGSRERIDEAVARLRALEVVVQNIWHDVGRRRSYLPSDGHGAVLRIIEQFAVVMAQEVESVSIGACEAIVDLVALQFGWRYALA